MISKAPGTRCQEFKENEKILFIFKSCFDKIAARRNLVVDVTKHSTVNSSSKSAEYFGRGSWRIPVSVATHAAGRV